MNIETRSPAPRVQEILAAAAGALESRTQTPRLDAEVLLAHVLDVGRTTLAARPEAALQADALERFHLLLRRRLEGEPVAYLTGRREFWSIELEVSRDVLIPRPETERLVEAALEHIPAGADPWIADVGTGCGAVALALSRERPRANILATDVSPAALEVARRNAARTGAKNIRFVACSWLEAVAPRAFDLILSNPPYIRDADPHLSLGDLRREPPIALAAGPDGLRAIRVIVPEAKAMLARGGVLLLEHGFDQGAAVRDLLKEAGYLGIFTLEDYAGHERISGGHP